MHLADFLRETQLLTGTHIGCEHGVCGACTIQIDGAPARSCITLAACEGAERTVEGFDDDPVMARLRDAFTKEHALQCGYCTPGMLVSARDIVRRLPMRTKPDPSNSGVIADVPAMSASSVPSNLSWTCRRSRNPMRRRKRRRARRRRTCTHAGQRDATRQCHPADAKHCNCSASDRRMAGLPRYRTVASCRARGWRLRHGWSHCWPYCCSTRPHPRHVQRIGRYRIRRCQSLRNSPRFRPRQNRSGAVAKAFIREDGTNAHRFRLRSPTR